MNLEPQIKFSTTNSKNFFRVVEILLQEGYELRVFSDGEGVFCLEGIVTRFIGTSYELIGYDNFYIKKIENEDEF